MNSKDKEQIVKTIVREMLCMMREAKTDPVILKGKDNLDIKEEGTHIPVAKEPQGSVKGTNKPREVGDRKRSQEKGELPENSEGYQNTVVQGLV
jgi:hypothetical protein